MRFGELHYWIGNGEVRSVKRAPDSADDDAQEGEERRIADLHDDMVSWVDSRIVG